MCEGKQEANLLASLIRKSGDHAQDNVKINFILDIATEKGEQSTASQLHLPSQVVECPNATDEYRNNISRITQSMAQLEPRVEEKDNSLLDLLSTVE